MSESVEDMPGDEGGGVMLRAECGRGALTVLRRHGRDKSGHDGVVSGLYGAAAEGRSMQLPPSGMPAKRALIQSRASAAPATVTPSWFAPL